MAIYQQFQHLWTRSPAQHPQGQGMQLHPAPALPVWPPLVYVGTGSAAAAA